MDAFLLSCLNACKLGISGNLEHAKKESLNLLWIEKLECPVFL